MMIKFDQQTFRGLVKLYLWTFPVLVVAVAIDLFYVTGWEFSDAFDTLVAEHFSPLIDENILLALLSASLLVHFAATMALLKFKRWAPAAFIWSPIALIVLDIVTLGYPVYTSAIISLLITISTALYGAIALLCFGKDQGGVWFFSQDSSGI